LFCFLCLNTQQQALQQEGTRRPDVMDEAARDQQVRDQQIVDLVHLYDGSLKSLFVTSFITNYQDKNIGVCDENGCAKVLDGAGLETWLTNTASEELQLYTEKDGYFIEPILRCDENGRTVLVGGLLYRWDADDACIYLGQLFVHPDFQRQGFASGVLQTLWKRIPGVQRYEALVRCGNRKGWSFFDKLGFKPDLDLVKKYGYSNDFYMGLFKDLKTD
jgi:GNAT superfamily N-acetyltransferase